MVDNSKSRLKLLKKLKPDSEVPMLNSKNIFRLLQLLLLAVISFGLAGCATAYRPGTVAANSMQMAATEIQIECNHFNGAIESLDNLVNHPAADLRPQFNSYNKSVDRLYKSVERVENAVSRMQKKNAENLENWDKQLATLNYGITRDVSETRKKEVSDQLAAIQLRYVKTREVVLPVLAYFEDIRKILGADLTVSGLQAARPVANNAMNNGRKMQLALLDLSNQLENSDRSLSPLNMGKADSEQMTTQGRAQSGPQTEAQGKLATMSTWIKSSVFRMHPESNHVQNLAEP
ncbi:MAG: hypothetical protein QOD03_1660 [Verrucomicrobiota bacterium]|jgi:hypothetical protein